MKSFLEFRPRPGWRRVLLNAGVTALAVLLAACGDSDSGAPSGPERIPVASVRIAPVEGDLLVGAERALQAAPLSATGQVLDDRVVTWASENDAVATVSATGVVMARAAGATGISASSEGKSSRIEVRIVAPNPIPVLAGLSPATIAAGSEGPLAVDVTGAGFTDATRLRLDGAEVVTQRVDDRTLRMQLTTERLAAAATLSVTAATPAPGGGVSNALDLTIAAAPAPTIVALSPSRITAGWGAPFTLAITGSGFTARSEVQWDGAPRATRFIDAATLHVTIDPQDVRVARTVPVTVVTPAPGGGTAEATFAVNAVPVARVTVQSPWGLAWTWRNHGLPLTAMAEDQLGRELTDRRATWSIANPNVATAVPLGDREVRIYGASAGETDVEALVDGVRGTRTVRVHETPAFELIYEAGEGDDRRLMLWDLVTANAPRRIPTTLVAFSPSPSPDGNEVAFAGVEKGAGPAGNVDLFITTRDGNTRRVAPSAGFDGDPAWSPDGTKLAFTSSRASGALDIHVIELASGTIQQLTNVGAGGTMPGSGNAARAPTWSPDGMRIAYTVQVGGASQLWVMSASGTGKLQLTNAADANDYEPAWSPDGSVIAFARLFRGAQPAMVMTVEPDGRNVTNIGNRGVFVTATPAYSPDGRWLTTAQTRGSGAGALYAFSIAANAGPRIVMPEALGGGRHARWVRRP